METDKYIEVADRNFVTAKQTVEVQINMRYDNVKTFIATLYNVIFAPDLCDQLFSINMLINLGYTYLFPKGFCTVLFSANGQNAVILPHSAQKNMNFWSKKK